MSLGQRKRIQGGGITEPRGLKAVLVFCHEQKTREADGEHECVLGTQEKGEAQIGESTPWYNAADW